MEFLLRCVNITFVTTLIVYYYYPDTGKCQSATSQRICHSFVVLDQNSKLCEWNDRYLYCEMKPYGDVGYLILLFAAIAIAAAPLNSFLHSVVMNYLKSSTLCDLSTILEITNASTSMNEVKNPHGTQCLKKGNDTKAAQNETESNKDGGERLVV